MITNANYLIQKYAEASERVSNARGDLKEYISYWSGAKNTYHALLNEFFEGWAEPGSVGYYVFMKEMTYAAALGAYQRNLIKKEQ
jgi:hypothetical protein